MYICILDYSFVQYIIHSEMKNTDELDELIFNKWYVDRLTFYEISQVKLPSFLCLNHIRNIIYKMAKRRPIVRDNANYEEFIRDVYKLFRIKMLELQDVDEAIKYVFENQPKRKYSHITIRRAINREIAKRKL